MSGPGDRASKRGFLREPTRSHAAEGHGTDPNNARLEKVLPPGSQGSARSHMPHAREPGPLGGGPSPMVGDGLLREGEKPYAAGCPEGSDEGVVPQRSAKTWVTPVEPAEGRPEAEGKSAHGNARRAQDRERALTQVERIGQRAEGRNGEQFDNLMSALKVPLLKEAYQRLRRSAATGVDGVTWEEYGVGLDARLHDLQDRIHRGSYHPQPVRRVHIPKGDGRTRPLGIPALEDKVVQMAVRMVLEPIYESAFMGFSYGFRPGRSQHDALNALAEAIARKTSWVLDADIRSFFDTIDHEWMRKFIEHRIADRRMVRLLMKMLHAGVMEDGELREVQEGTPQGGIVSPLTQVNTRRRARGGRGRSFAVRLRRGSGRRHPVDDRRAFIIDLHARDERADQLLPLVPRESFEAMSDAGGEVLQATGDGPQGHGLGQPLLPPC